MNRYTTFDSPLGQILLVSDGSLLTGAYFSGQKYEPVPGPGWLLEPDLGIFQEASLQLHEYFAGRRRQFDILLHLQGTPFQTKVWKALLEIPHGSTVSYGELAGRIKRKDAVRAVGAAVGRNPVSVIVPCHRVIGSGGSLTGYAGGLERKRALLDLEEALMAGISSRAPACSS
ncbi:MAG: methylated-DNA--[protein]-cysteine S-methyltransferase [Syntrophobacteraceae bacterium]|jgi:methylated-DNA-[protein]-cysteine S-methyltransferase